MRDTFRSLAGRDFRLFFVAQSISLIGNWVQQFAMAWIVYRQTDSAFMLGLMAFCGQIPTLFLSPLGGLAADRWNKRLLLLVIQVLQMAVALTLALLAWRDMLATWHLIAAALAVGFVTAFEIPARLAFVPSIVPERAHLSNAIALNSVTVNTARMIGPAVAGFALATVDDAVCFALNAASFAAMIYALLAIRPVRAAPSTTKGTLGEATAYLKRFAPARWMLITVVVASLCVAPYLTFMPIYAKDIMHGGPDTCGILMTAYGLGALAAGIYLANRTTVMGLGPRIVMACFTAAAAAAAFAYNSLLVPALPLLLIAGSAQIIIVTSCNILLQSLVDDAMRGRVMAIYGMCFLGTLPVSSLIAGAIAQVIGVQPVFLISAVALVSLGLVLKPRLAALREEALPVLHGKGHR